jgi:hypothetical protein
MSFLDDPPLDETTPPVEELQKGGGEGESK